MSTETVALLAARSPKLGRALTDAKQAGHAYVVIDGTLIPIDRVAADRPFYSGKHRRHGMNLQVISAPDGEILWVSGPLPGATHDLTAARIWGIVRELAAAGLVVLADKGYIGAGEHMHTPYRGRNKPASQKAANRAHAQLRSPGERANAQLKTWHILRKLRCCPWRAGQLAKATMNVGTGVNFTQARIGTEFGDTPWSAPAFTAPASQQKTASIFNGTLTNYRGQRYGLTGYWVNTPLIMTGAGSVTEAAPGAIGSNAFNTYLVP